jgi:hypothetical protein
LCFLPFWVSFWRIWVSLIGQAKISTHVEKQAQWYVPRMLHSAMVLMSCTMGMWIHRMGVWIYRMGVWI